ncbi:MAG: hypothetical protein WBM87_09760 [Woeseiaceae bacterium]
MNEIPDTAPPAPSRATLARDIIVLQAKLLVDGLRDLILVPASLIVGIAGLLSFDSAKPGAEFYRLLHAGKQSEHWINLFGALRNAPPDLEDVKGFPDADMDDIVGRLETYMVEEHRRGGITAQAKDRLDKALDTIKRRGGHSKS